MGSWSIIPHWCPFSPRRDLELLRTYGRGQFVELSDTQAWPRRLNTTMENISACDNAATQVGMYTEAFGLRGSAFAPRFGHLKLCNGSLDADDRVDYDLR